MQQKYLKYLLLFGAAVVWGIIILRVISGLSDGPGTQQTLFQKPAFKIRDSASYQPYDLLLTYTDPFGAEEDKTGQNNINGAPEKGDILFKDNDPVKNVKTDIGFILYKGMIANTVTHKKAAIISINGKDELAQTGKLINNIRINEIEKNRILISYLGGKYWVKKQ